MSATLMNRVLAYCVMVMVSFLGGGALLLFSAFLIAGPFALVRFDLSQTQILLVDAVLSLLFFVQHSGMVRQSFRSWLAPTVPRAYHQAVYAIASGLALCALVVLWQASGRRLSSRFAGRCAGCREPSRCWPSPAACGECWRWAVSTPLAGSQSPPTCMAGASSRRASSSAVPICGSAIPSICSRCFSFGQRQT